MKCGMKFIFCMQVSIKSFARDQLHFTRLCKGYCGTCDLTVEPGLVLLQKWLLGKIYRLSVYIEPSQRIMEDFQILQKELVLGYFYFYFKQKMFLKRNCTISNVKLSFGTNKLPCKLKNVYSQPYLFLLQLQSAEPN